ncbi:fumarylacetoacetate hydrolase family protein [Novosphingobium terrae]|uniref:fumarylacetoacetate hydrolase family protein n=1 Tax=Novosphingobium terrae TaxID=2726189 RepID=UPI00198116E7|nr:fumarylacetoacetate hydrolase family protein [Novosphingobium terrae]
MKLLRYEQAGAIHLGVLKEDKIIPLDGLAGDYPSMLSIVSGGDAALAAVRKVLEAGANGVALSAVQLITPIERPGKYLAIGMNYGKHLEESDKLGVARSAYQIWFNKQTTCVSGPYDDIVTGNTQQLDYEVELGMVIGKAAKNVSAADARKHIFGYVVANDVSARDYQFHAQTMMMGKSFDTHGPIGPWIVTDDEIADPQALDLRCFVNGEERQSSNTALMLNKLWDQIAYLSSAFTLEPGDLIATGTPEGVGIGRDPKVFLQPGDVVRCEIEGIGAIENTVVA